MVSLAELVDQMKDLKFNIEKAEFNDNPTEVHINRLHVLEQRLIQLLQDEFDHHFPKILPPLQVHNPRPVIDTPISSELQEIIEDYIGLEDEDDEQLLLQLRSENPDHRSLINALGVWYIYQFQADQATGYFQQLEAHNPEDYVYFNLSYALAVQKVLQPALERLDRISSSFEPALVALNKAVIFDKLGRYEDAKSNFQQALDNESHQALILFNWALSAMNFGKLAVARNLFKKILQLHPNYPGVHAQLGQLSAQQGFYTEAIDAFRIAHREDESNLGILSDLATACLMGRRYEDAIDYFEEYLEHETSLSVLNNLGAAYLHTKEYEKAEHVLKKALEINPNHKQSMKNYELAKSYLA